MGKMRIYEYAKKNNTTSKEIVEQLGKLNYEVKNHMSSVTGPMKKDLDKIFQNSKPAETNQPVADQKQHNTKAKQKETRGKMKSNTTHPSKKKQKGKQKKQSQSAGKTVAAQETPEHIVFTNSLTVSGLAEKLNKDVSEIIKKLMFLGVMANKNQDLDEDTIELICSDYGVTVEKEIVLEDTDFKKYIKKDKKNDLIERPAVVTIMGHVDHGKTTLLDSVRHTKVTAGEAGGITQHIGAYQAESDGKKVTFLDTPGHEAFTSMRSRGAQVTDIAILVVAADDGVMPQTVEAINHAKAAEVPIIIAVNKMDKETANPERVMQELTEYELIPEDWGGDTIFVHISALQNEGIDDLLEMLLLVAEMEELTANPNTSAFGTVIDAELDKGRGAVATLLVQNGTLSVGETLVVGNTYGRVRAMVNDQGERVQEAGPSMPVEITGLNDVPEAGDQFLVFSDERKARQIGKSRQQKQIAEKRRVQTAVSLDDLFEQIKEGDMKELNIIIKADVQGSAEALAASLS